MVQVLFCSVFLFIFSSGLVMTVCVLLRIAAALSKIETAIEDGDLRIRNVTDPERDSAYEQYIRAFRSGRSR